MPAYTMSPFPVPRITKSNLSSPRSGAPQLMLDVNGSKVQHLLGISNAELTSARSQSLSSSSTSRVPPSSLSEATTIPVPGDVTAEKLSSLHPSPELRLKASSVVLGDDFERGSATTGASSSQLSRYPSSSTLHSHYDPSKAPLSISQQTSDSSSRDFALRKGARSVIARTGREMEHARQMLFFKSAKPGSRESKRLTKTSPTSAGPRTSSPLGNNHQLRDTTDGRHTLFPSAISPPATSRAPVTSTKKLFASLRRSESQHIRAPPVNTNVTHDPYAKINVRRPKAGAKHWFDGIEGESSDEDDHGEPELKQNFVNEVQRAFGSSIAETTQSRTDSSQITVKPSEADELRTPKATAPLRTAVRASVSPATTTDQMVLGRKVSFRREKHEIDQRTVVAKRSRNTLNAFAGVDLNKQSMLSLSSSDDEDEATGSKRPQPLQPAPPIRESLAGEHVDDSDIEIGLAHAIKVRPGELLARTAHSPTDLARKSSLPAPPIHVPARASSRNASYILDQSSENDASESDIISSFPATPSDTASFRTSIRSSILSDSGSLASTRPMLVTKQEEKLLAAMRLKRAAMSQSMKDTDRKGALRVLESGGRNSVLSSRASRHRLSEQARLDLRMSNRYTPSRLHMHQRSLSSNEADNPSGYIRESGTTFDTSTYSVRNSQATMRTTFSDDPHASYSASSGSEATATSPSARYAHLARSHRRDSGRRDTYFSMTSDGSSYRPDSHIVVLDGLDEALTRESIPSQLFMEAPFIGWERAGLTAAH